MQLNSAQTAYLARFPAGTDFHSLPAIDRLHVANLATPTNSKVPESKPEMTEAAKQWLGDWDPATLSPENREHLEYLNGPRFQRVPETEAANASEAKAVPFELDLERLNREPGDRRMAIHEDFQVVQRGRGERDRHPALREISEERLRAAETRLRNYLKR